jgi:riboflavin biosynthesis pyrimidine reductase
VAFRPLEPVRFRRLHPGGGEVGAEEVVAGLELGGRATAERPYVVVNMVATADGKAALDGRTRGLGGVADRALFHHLRTRVDAVMVGRRTAAIERYPRLVRDEALRERRAQAGLAPDPLAVIVSSPRAHDEHDVPLLDDDEQPSLVLTAPVTRPDAPFDPRPLLEELRAHHGVRLLLSEGGPTLNAALLEYGLVDELFLSITPLLAGGEDARTIVGGAPLPSTVELELMTLLEHDGELFARYAVQKSLQTENGPVRS